MYDAKIIADSIMPAGNRITTMEVVMPRIVLAEFNTHRMLSRNSASSRAIPFKKMVKTVEDNPFVPIAWMKEHSGMQGTEFFGDLETFTSTNPNDKFAPGVDYIDGNRNGTRRIKEILKENWLWLRNMAVSTAKILNNSGVHYYPDGDTSKLSGDGRGLTKQMCNRLLETFMWHKVLVTATEWENFFSLRAHPDAEIHIQKVAETMLDAMNASVPNKLEPGQWHIPYGDQINLMELFKAGAGDIWPGLDDTYESEVEYDPDPNSFYQRHLQPAMRKIATARCAQVSYTVVGADEKEMDYVKLIALHDRLALSGHWSPFEHCAKAMTDEEWYLHSRGADGSAHHEHGWCGNFRGWIQYRKTLPNENRSDSRLIKKEYKDGR